MKKEHTSYPVGQSIDLAHITLKASISCLPVIGGAIAEFFNVIVPSRLSNRRDEWARQLTDTVNELLERGAVTAENLNENDNFVDAVIEATIQATKTSSEAKRVALASAVSAVACRSIDTDRQHVFLRLINELTESHIRLLHAYGIGKFTAASGHDRNMENHFIDLVCKELPELALDQSFILLLCADLAGHSLIGIPEGRPKSLGGMNYNCMHITLSGTAFLKFIGAM